MRKLFAAGLGTALLAASLPAWVHHSGAMFDQTRSEKVTGTVTEFNWTNPHASFKIEAPNREGKMEVWAVEMNSPNNLVRAGWKRTTIKPGDKVTVVLHPLRDGKPGGLYLGITLPDGKFLGEGQSGNYSSEKPAAAAAESR